MKKTAIALALAYAAAFSFAVPAQQRADDGPQLTGNMLMRPANYREWVFLSSGLGMTYAAPGGAANRAPQVGNVDVKPSSYRAFMQRARWPDRSIVMHERRASATEGRIDRSGR